QAVFRLDLGGPGQLLEAAVLGARGEERPCRAPGGAAARAARPGAARTADAPAPWRSLRNTCGRRLPDPEKTRAPGRLRAVQAAVLLAVEPLVLHLPAITPPFLGDLLHRAARHRQRRQPGEVPPPPFCGRLRAFQGVELPGPALAVLVVQLPDPAELLHQAVAP